MREDVFEDDGRHVTRQGVDKIVGAFLRAHCAD
jgi:formate dehydrogenase assembly factor FdhD